MQNIVSEHEQYLDAVRDFNDWLVSAKEELQRWSDLSGDSVSIKRKLSKVQVRKNVTERNKCLKKCLLWGFFQSGFNLNTVPSQEGTWETS